MTNKNLFTLKAAAAAVIFVAALSGCAKDPKPTYPDVESVTVSQQALTLEVGESATLTAKVSPEGVESTEVVWSSDKPEVATVDAATGEVKAVAVGTAVITAKSAISAKSGECAVSVMPTDILDAITDPVFKAYALDCMKSAYHGWDGGTEINKREYPAWDGNSDGKLTWREAAAVECIDLNDGYDGKTVSSLAGIEYFTGLKVLDCNSNELTKLDISRNTELKSLDCNYNQLESLDVTKNTALTNLFCFNNQLESLDVTNCTALTYLDCGVNKLESLDVTNCTALTYLDCYGNQLESLDVANRPTLTNLYCYGNQLESLDVTNCTALTDLNCGGNKLESLDVTKYTALTSLVCWDNQLTELDASKMADPEGYWLYCGNQKDGQGKVQTLTLTLRDEQKPSWDSKWASNDNNTGVVLAGE